MSITVIGVDASMTRTALVALPSDARLVIPSTSKLATHRRLRLLAEGAWRFVEEQRAGGKVFVVVEEPGWAGRPDMGKAAVVIAMARGAVLAGLNPSPDVRVEQMPVNKVRADLGIALTRKVGDPSTKEQIVAWVRAQGYEVPMRRSGDDDDDIADAIVLALWGRSKVGTL